MKIHIEFNKDRAKLIDPHTGDIVLLTPGDHLKPADKALLKHAQNIRITEFGKINSTPTSASKLNINLDHNGYVLCIGWGGIKPYE